MDKKQRRHKSSKGSSASTKSTPMSSFVESVPGCTAVPFTTEKYPNYPNESFYMPESEAMYRNADSNVNASGSHNFRTNFAAAPADNSNLIYSSECSSSQGTDSMHSVANTRASIPMGTYFSAASLAFDHSTAAEQSPHPSLGQGSGILSYPNPSSSWSQTPVQHSPATYTAFGDAFSAWPRTNSSVCGVNFQREAGFGSEGPAYYESDTMQPPSFSQESSFRCDVEGCGKAFTRSYNYKAHLETHDEKREYPFQCPVDKCDKKFARKTDLQRHHQSVHMKERNHGCAFCGRSFARKDTLRRHMEDGCSKRFDIETIDLDRA